MGKFGENEIDTLPEGGENNEATLNFHNYCGHYSSSLVGR